MTFGPTLLQPRAPGAARVALALSPGDPFWVQVREAVKQRAVELGIDLVRVPPPSQTAEGVALLGFIEDLHAIEARALICHVLSSSSMRALLDDGMPLICAEETTLLHPLLTSVSSLSHAAEMAGEILAQRLGPTGNVLMVGGLDDPAATTRARLSGFRAVLARYPGWRCIHVPTLWRYAEVVEHLSEESDQLLAGFPSGHIDAIFGLSDPIALATRDVCRGLGLADHTTHVVGINGDPLAIAAIEAGTMLATVESSPLDLGCRLAEFSKRAALGESLPDHFPYRLELITAENVSQVAARKLVQLADLPTRLVDVNRRQEEERLRQLRASIEMNRRLGEFLEWGDLLRTLAEIIRSRYGYDHVQLYRWSDDGQCLVLAAADEHAPSLPGRIPVAQAGVLAETLLRNRALYIPDTRTSRRYLPEPEGSETRARVVLPIRLGSKTLGVLDLHSHERSVRTQAELDALQTLADQLGGAMQNAQLYKQALAAKAQAEESNRMRARLLANLSHGLRTPLNVILGYSQNALAQPNPYGVALPAALMEDLRFIQQSGADLLRLVNDLLDVAQAESGSLPLYPERVETRAFLAELFAGAEGVMSTTPGVSWQLQLPAQLPELFVDPVRLRSVLLNLLSNAARATESGTIRFGAAAADETIHIWVQDTGRGLPESRLAELLPANRSEWGEPGGSMLDSESATTEAFARKGADGSPGLGLGIAQHLLRRMGGRLAIASAPGQGTDCRVVLPITATAAPEDMEEIPLLPEPEAVAPVTSPSTEQENAPFSLSLRGASPLVRRGVEYLAANFASPVTRDDLARILERSPAYVSRIFQRELGLSPWEVLIHMRLERARELLLDADRTVIEVALAVGFNDPAYFARTFRRELGLSPQEYRAKAGHHS